MMSFDRPRPTRRLFGQPGCFALTFFLCFRLLRVILFFFEPPRRIGTINPLCDVPKVLIYSLHSSTQAGNERPQLPLSPG